MVKELENLLYTFEFLENKKYREILCKNVIDENYLLTPLIIKNWELNRIENKYLLKSRNYQENSYSKKKLKEEEILFLHKIILFLKYRFYVEEQKKFTDIFNLLSCFEINKEKDLKLYKDIMLLRNDTRPIKLLAFSKNDVIRLDILNDSLNIIDIREKIIKKSLKINTEISLKIMETYKLGRISDKYIIKIRDFKENYYVQTKIKEEEILFITKLFLFSVWNNRLHDFNQREQEMSQLKPDMYKGIEGKKNNDFLSKINKIYVVDFYNDNILY